MLLQFLKNRNIKNNLYSLGGNAFQAGLAFITFLILVRFMDSANFGKWVIFITVATLMDMFRLGLTGAATIRLISLNNQEGKESAIGASYQLSLITSAITVVIFWSLYWIIPDNEFSYIFLFYPILAICNVPYYQATIVFQGVSDFSRLSILKLLNAGLILVLISALILWEITMTVKVLIVIYTIANIATSLIVIIKKWDGASCISKGNKAYRKKILDFGKYSTASYVGSNLLKSSDTLILGLSPFMGVEAVAIYAIPFKFVEMIEVVLRSFASTAYPKLSQALKEKGNHFFKYLMTYIGICTLIFIPISTAVFLFPETLLNILGGSNYADQLPIQKTILYIISIYVLFLPADRFTGVALFAMNKAKLNFYKITFMLVFNILFDIVAVFVFKSLALVALATLLFTLIGILIGWKYVRHSSTEYAHLQNNFSVYILYNIRQLKKWLRPHKQIHHRA